jgi:hypothetical protein
MMRVHGIGPITFFTNSGPPTDEPGNTLTISLPSSWAYEISLAEPQPGLYGIARRLQTFATSAFKIGPTTNFAPLAMKIPAVGASTMEPTPMITLGSALSKYFVTS